jgi:3-dehydroquinate dehydratase-2
MTALERQANSAGVGLETFQSNHEGALIDRSAGCRAEGVASSSSTRRLHPHQRGLARRPGGRCHSFRRSALSNVHAREPFRRHSYFSDIAVGVICGLGSQGYLLALDRRSTSPTEALAG